jgi:hypothetical protein
VAELTAGQLSVRVAGTELRDIRVAGYPALDAVYVTVRDAAWRTIPGELVWSRRVRTEAGETVELEVRHQQDETDFRWRGTAEVTPDRVRFTFDGRAGSDFAANRIGLCLLHPQVLKGRAVQVSGPAGERQSRFPEWISPYQPFTDVQRMSCDVGEGAGLEIRLTGDLFEVEDHRNWSDPGWKTYCPPLSAARPVRHRAGDRVRQTVELTARVAGPRRIRRPAGGRACLIIGPDIAGRMPALGLGASCLPDPDEAVLSAVRALRPAYLHVELEGSRDWEQGFELAAAEAAALGVPLDVALVAALPELPAMAARISRLGSRPGRRLGRVSAYSPDRHTTDAPAVSALRAALAAARPASGAAPAAGGGSRANFAELNRGTFSTAGWDFVTYGLTPQVHHTDDRSIMSTIAAIGDGLHQAETIAGGRPVVVGPVTLRPRFNPDLGRPDELPPPTSGPDLDDRQRTDVAAVYLAGALTQLVGAQAVTAYRTAGPRGIVAEDGTALPAAEVVRLFAALGGAPVHASSCDDPQIVALPAVSPTGLTVVAVNLSEQPKPLELPGAELRAARVLGDGSRNPAGCILPERSVMVLDAVPRARPQARRS